MPADVRPCPRGRCRPSGPVSRPPAGPLRSSREVRGEIAAPPATAPAAAPAKGHAPPPAHVRAAAADHAAERVTGPVFEPVEEDDEPATDADATRYTDGTDADGGDLEEEYASRPLSKAEKKRLRKLARSGTAA